MNKFGRILLGVGIFLGFGLFVLLIFQMAAMGTIYSRPEIFIQAFNPFSEFFKLGILTLGILATSVSSLMAYCLSDFLILT